MSMNRVILIGNLGKDPELKHASSGTPVCRFSLATNERFKNKAGGPEQRTEWHSIVCFGRLAEVCGKYLAKGKLCYIEGTIRSRKWMDQDGKERKFFDIVATQMRMLSSSNGREAKSKTESAKAGAQGKPSQDAAHPLEDDNPYEADDSDIPF